jgi:hypothetical protein
MVVISTGITLFGILPNGRSQQEERLPHSSFRFLWQEPKPHKPQEVPLDGCYTLVK